MTTPSELKPSRPSATWWNMWLSVFTQEMQRAFRRKEDSLSSVFFFVVVCSLMPLAIGPDQDMLSRIGPGVVWVSALLASLLSLHRFFQDDLEDGYLDLLMMSPLPPSLSVLAKVAAHWLRTGLLLSLISPLLALQFQLSGEQAFILFASLLLGTPVLSLLGAAGAALTLGSRGGGLLLSLLLLPLLVPVLIFGSASVTAHSDGLSSQGHFLVLTAFLVLSLFFGPWVAAISLKIAID